MNIFILSWNIVYCAQWHCDKHCVKMILEYAQLLSTAHRYLDGTMYQELTKSKRNMKRWKLEDPQMNDKLYVATHINHPCAIWVRESSENYIWLYRLFVELCKEYTHRYNKTHLTYRKLGECLSVLPRKIPNGSITEPPQAMPDEYKCDNPLDGYRGYYLGDKQRMLKWSKRRIPRWCGVSV